ncbi:MAG TPA: hypothetical protein PKW61_06270 [Tenuifilaceae bacterium]|nr:hypothetical protein [Tenuifilaceae bacterium]HPV56714.1 hypothetical protein [Tenuifilaceae bacterium]
MSLKSAVEEWSKKRLPELVKSYHDLGLRASGKWAASLEGNTTQENNTIKTVILGEQYTGALVGGRKPTSAYGPYQKNDFTLREAIAIWIRQKGITPDDGISKDSLAFLIARKIHREGIRVPNEHNSGKLISNVFTDKAINELGEVVKKELGNVVSTEVMKGLKE